MNNRAALYISCISCFVLFVVYISSGSHSIANEYKTNNEKRVIAVEGRRPGIYSGLRRNLQRSEPSRILAKVKAKRVKIKREQKQKVKEQPSTPSPSVTSMLGRPDQIGQSSVEPVSFYVLGDIPYTASEEPVLMKQLQNLETDSGELFVVHVGDLQKGSSGCFETTFERSRYLLEQSPLPLFVQIGDNDWNDCPRPSEALTYWFNHLNRIEETWSAAENLNIMRQGERDENFALIQKNILFVGVNLVGGVTLDSSEWKTRHQQNLDWVLNNIELVGKENLRALVIFGHADPTGKHDDFFDPLSEAVEDNNIPVLYIHGDGHDWYQQNGFKGNILNVQVDAGVNSPPVRVTVDPEGVKTFVFDRRL